MLLAGGSKVLQWKKKLQHQRNKQTNKTQNEHIKKTNKTQNQQQTIKQTKTTTKQTQNKPPNPQPRNFNISNDIFLKIRKELSYKQKGAAIMQQLTRKYPLALYSFLLHNAWLSEFRLVTWASWELISAPICPSLFAVLSAWFNFVCI